MIRLLLKPVGVALWMGLLLAAGLQFGGAESFRSWEYDQLDDRFRNLSNDKRKFPSNIVLVEINNDSVHTKERFPWDQAKMASLIANLRQNNPKTIVLDVPLLHKVDPTHVTPLTTLLTTFNKLHPPPARPAPKANKKKKKARRRRRLSRRQQAELAKKQAIEKQAAVIRKELKKLSGDPSHTALLNEIKKTKNLVLSYRYYKQESDIPGADGFYFKSLQKADKAEKRTPPPARKAGKKGKKDAKKQPAPRKAPPKATNTQARLFQVKREIEVNGGSPIPPALEVFFLRDHPTFSPLVSYHGFTNLQDRPGGVVHKARLLIRKGKKVYPSLALAAYIAFSGETPAFQVSPNGYTGMVIGKTTLPITPKGEFWLNYYGPKTRIPRGQRLLAGDVVAGKNVTKSDIEGKLVFVGVSSTPYARSFQTPYKRPFSAIEMHATITANLLKTETLQRNQQTQFIELGLLIVFALLLGLLSMKFRHFLGFLSTIALIGVLQFLNNFVFFPGGDWFQFLYIQCSLVVVFVAISFFRRITEDVTRNETRSRFQTRLGEEDYRRVLKRPQDLPLDGVAKELSVISGQCLPLGASLNEEQQPKQIAKMLAHLINPLNEAICRNRGTIGHLDGHSFQGFFNAPFDLPNHAEQACQAALQMRSESEPFFHQWQIEELPLPSFSVGLDTGFAITGNFGGSERFHFSATGAPFERSQQLKQLNQQYGSQILLSQEMAAQVMESGKFIIREIDKVRFHDDQEPMTVYELLGATPISSPLHEAVDWYQHGLQFYRSRNFQEAIRYFQEILRVRPDDGPARVMLERSQHYVHYPPSFQWDGTWKAK